MHNISFAEEKLGQISAVLACACDESNFIEHIHSFQFHSLRRLAAAL
jgi:hypothetical protein